MSALLDDLQQRGLISEVTSRGELSKLLEGGSISLYAGYDPTARSLHIGNLVPTILLRRFQLAGHRPIVLVGGATGMIGDPSGKSVERNLQDDSTIQDNLAGIRAQLERLLDFKDPKTGAIIVNNHDWTKGISFLEFLRDYGKHLTINYMMAKDSVKSRISRTGEDTGTEGISYTEFSYMLLQAFDFVHLSRAEACRLQVGGSDQFGNITAGCELSRKMGGHQLFALVAPLMLDSSGEKMGKTSTGERVSLDATEFSPYKFYQYWLNRSDEEGLRFLRWFSTKPMAELDAVIAEHETDRSKRVVQRELARAMTAWVHGEAEIARAETAGRVMFEGSLDGVTDADLDALTGVETLELPRGELEAGIGFVDLMSRAFGESKGATRRLIEGGGAYLNNAQVKDAARKIALADLATATRLILRSGKKDRRLVRVI